MKTPDHLLIRRDDARKREMLPRDRPAKNPGGMQCERCDEIFVGEEWHTLCGLCIQVTADEIAHSQQPAMTHPLPGSAAALADELEALHKMQAHTSFASECEANIETILSALRGSTPAVGREAARIAKSSLHGVLEFLAEDGQCPRLPDAYMRADIFVDELLAALRSVEPPGGGVREALDNDPDQSFVDMLWKWFEDRGCDLRSERLHGLTADDFRVMLDEHEVALAAPPLDRDARREQYARIINPELFVEYDLLVNQGTVAENGKPWAEVVFGTKIQRLLAKADALLALDSNDGAQREVGAALERTLSQYDKTIDRAKEDAALSDSGRERIIQDCLAAKAAVRSFAGNLSALSVSVRSGVQRTTEQSSTPIGHQK